MVTNSFAPNTPPHVVGFMPRGANASRFDGSSAIPISDRYTPIAIDCEAMMDKVKCIVVGAGPAGAACAHALARKGIEVVLLERGGEPGEKNVASCVILTPVLEYLIPDYRERAPLERNVLRFETVAIGKRDYKVFQNQSYNFIDEPVCFTAFRGPFDAWFAQEAVDAGAELVTGMTVTDLIRDQGRVVGVRVGEEELYADVVVGADGFHSVVAENSGLIEERDPAMCYLGVKEVLDLPSDVINQRFHLRDGEGCVQECYYYPTGDGNVGYTLYTNNDSVSLAIFGIVETLKGGKIRLHEELDEIKKHPYMHALIGGGKLREYQAHIITIGEPVDPKTLYADGVLLCGEAGRLMDASGTGAPTSMLSGMMAAETIELAIRKNDYSAKVLKNYVNYLDSTSVLRTMYSGGKATSYVYGRGGDSLPEYRETLAQLMETSLRERVDFIKREPYPFWKIAYLEVGRHFAPAFIRWLITGWVRSSCLCSRLCNQLRRRFRRRYYDWSKSYEGGR
jgi:electron transfer flavoprotein-quinone oxidoreductase